MTAIESSWHSLCPWPILQDEVLQKVAKLLADTRIQAELRELERKRQYPADIRKRLHSLGLAELFCENGSPSRLTMYHLCALNQLTAFTDASLAITVGVNALALLPLYIRGTQQQLDWVFSQMRSGSYVSLLLSELPHGTDLLRNDTCAESGFFDDKAEFQSFGASTQTPTCYRVYGEKHLINGGTRNQVLVLLARTRRTDAMVNDALSSRDSLSVFFAQRDSTTEALPPWPTLPAAGADISGVRFNGTIVPAHQRIGDEGEGLSVIQKTLAFSRGGVSALASGLASRALTLTKEYAWERRIYGAPLFKLGAISDHLLRMQALDSLIASMSLKATAMANALGVAAAHYTAVAKYACCALAEELVTEGRYVHGSRALLLDSTFQPLLGDVLLYGVFDGTSHVVLDQIQWRLTQIAAGFKTDGSPALNQVAEFYSTPAQSLIQVARQRRQTFLIDLSPYLSQLGKVNGTVSLLPLQALCDCLFAFTRECRTGGIWDQDQGLRFDAGKVLAWIEVLLAFVELADPPRRKALGISDLPHFRERFVTYTYGWFGARIAGALRALVQRIGLEGISLEGAERELNALFQSGRAALLKAELGP